MNWQAMLLRSTRCLVCLLILGLTGGTGIVYAATAATSEEMATARRWVAAKFESPPQTPNLRSGLVVLANHDPVLQNTRGEGRPLTIANATYDRGLYCHAKSTVVVRLPGPGKTFTAVVGVDSNDQTIAGRGSVVFSVRVGDQQKFRSQVMREGMAGVPADRGPGRGHRVCAAGRRCGRQHFLRPVGLGCREGRVERWERCLAGRSSHPGRRSGRDDRPAVFVCLRWPAVRRAAEIVGGQTRISPPGRPTDPTHAHLHRSEDRLGSPLRGDRVPRFPDGRVDTVFREPGRGRHAAAVGYPGDRHAVSSRRRGRVHAASQHGKSCRAERLPAPCHAVAAQSDAADRDLRRPLDEQRHAVFQRRLAGARRHRGARLAGPVGCGVPPRRRDRSARSRRPGTDPLQAPAGGRGADAVGGRPVLERGRRPVAEHLAPLDARTQSPPARRKTDAAGAHDVYQRFLSRHAEQRRG